MRKTTYKKRKKKDALKIRIYVVFFAVRGGVKKRAKFALATTAIHRHSRSGECTLTFSHRNSLFRKKYLSHAIVANSFGRHFRDFSLSLSSRIISLRRVASRLRSKYDKYRAGATTTNLCHKSYSITPRHYSNVNANT